MLTLLILACATEKGPALEVRWEDSGLPDTGAPEVRVPPLGHTAAWASLDHGYSTGGALADLDGDGDPDLVVANGNDMAPGALVVYTNDGAGLEERPSWISETERYYGHITVADVSGDGLPDVVASVFLGDLRFDSPGGVEVFLNRGGELESTPGWTAEGFFSFSNALGDMDGDGDLDLAVAVGEAYVNDPDLSLVFENDGFGSFGLDPVWTTEQPRYSFDVAWADMNSDGVSDLVFANSGSGHTMYLGPILSAEGPAWTAEGGGFEGNTLDVGDLDLDGALDLVVSDNDQLGGAGVVRAWCGPDLTLCWTSGDGAMMQSAVSLEDVDLDGDLDLFAGSWWGPVRQYENIGGALEPTPAWISTEPDTVIEAFSWADVDGDGLRDLAVTNWTETGPNLLYTR